MAFKLKIKVEVKQLEETNAYITAWNYNSNRNSM